MDRWQILKGIQPPPPVLPPEPSFRVMERYRARHDRRDRGGLVSTDPKSIFIACRCHFHQGLKMYVLCKSEANQEICCAKLGRSRWRIGVPLVRYKTDKMGNVYNPLNYDVLPWIFGEHTYVDLKRINEGFPLISHDIVIGCTNEDYQKLDLMPSNESLWQLNEEMKGNVLKDSLSVREFIKKGLAADKDVLELEGILRDTVSNP